MLCLLHCNLHAHASNFGRQLQEFFNLRLMLHAVLAGRQGRHQRVSTLKGLHLMLCIRRAFWWNLLLSVRSALDRRFVTLSKHKKFDEVGLNQSKRCEATVMAMGVQEPCQLLSRGLSGLPQSSIMT